MEKPSVATIAESINVLGTFCGMRDLPKLDANVHADVMVLFGGSILAGGDLLADAIREHVAEKYIIVGGAGHTTGKLRERFQAEYPKTDVSELTEAEVFSLYLSFKYGLKADYLEKESTNCGNNITFLLQLLVKESIPHQKMIFVQDASMQRRMYATALRQDPTLEIVNYAAYRAAVTEKNGELQFTDSIHGMWDMERYISLLMGEIPRLTDDENGYGPKGKDYIAHVDIPPNVMAAFENLKAIYPELVREANPLYATK